MGKTEKSLISILIVLLLAILFLFGYLYGIKKCAPNIHDFIAAEKFERIVFEEICKIPQNCAWGSDIFAFPGGPIFQISSRKVSRNGTHVIIKEVFKKNIKIREEIRNKVLISTAHKNYNDYQEDFERVRPLAKEIASAIVEAYNRK